MSRLPLEPSPHTTHAREIRPAPRSRGVAVGQSTSRDAGRATRGALVGAAIGAVAAGLGGAEYGLFLVVAGVWTVRWVWGLPPGAAWGLAVLAAGFRWDTTSFSDLAAAARLAGPGLVATPHLAAAGVALAAVGALTEESARDGLRGRSIAERLAASAAVVSLVAAAASPRLGDPIGAAWLAGGSVVAAALMLSTTAVARRIPRWMPALACLAGAVAIGLA